MIGDVAKLRRRFEVLLESIRYYQTPVIPMRLDERDIIVILACLDELKSLKEKEDDGK